MSNSLTQFLIHVNNFLIYPYFKMLGAVESSFALWITVFSSYFVFVVGILMIPVMRWYFGKKGDFRKNITLSFFSSATAVILVIGQIVLFILADSRSGLINPALSGEAFLSLLLFLVFFTTSSVMYVGAVLLQKKKNWSFRPRLLSVTTAASALSVLTVGFIVWMIFFSGICVDAEFKYVSSGYPAHTKDLCLNRADKSECPKSPEELRAFRTEDYDKLQKCYTAEKGAFGGYYLVPRLHTVNIF